MGEVIAAGIVILILTILGACMFLSSNVSPSFDTFPDPDTYFDDIDLDDDTDFDIDTLPTELDRGVREDL